MHDHDRWLQDKHFWEDAKPGPLETKTEIGQQDVEFVEIALSAAPARVVTVLSAKPDSARERRAMLARRLLLVLLSVSCIGIGLGIALPLISF